MAAPPKTQVFTVIVVSDHSQAVRKFRVPRRWLANVALRRRRRSPSSGSSPSATTSPSSAPRRRTRVLKEENAQLRSQILLVQEKVAHISATLDRVERFDAKLRTAVTQLQDPERNLAIGPVGERRRRGAIPGPRARPRRRASPALPGQARLARDGGDAPGAEPARAAGVLRRPASLLASTPSIWPARGWVTSDFGTRLDPYTAERMMHQGLDIATPHGQPVYTPSDGTVVFAGTEGGYGKVLVSTTATA